MESKQQPASTWKDRLDQLRLLPWKRILSQTVCKVGRAMMYTLIALTVLYLWGIVFYHGPGVQGGVVNALLGLAWLGSLLWLLRWKVAKKFRAMAILSAALLVIIPYSLIKPSNDRDWQPDFARTGYNEIRGDVITFYHLRNFDYPKNADVVKRWETRRVRLSRLQGLDLFHDTFMGDLMAHPILSFDFGEDGRVCLSVETRREKDEAFTPFGGLYKMFELQYVFATEEDCIRVRTNVRKEPVYHYRINATQDEIREMFLTSLAVQNELAETPRFYNVIVANCTTSLRAQRPIDKRGRWDIRLLFNGLLDEYLYERDRLVSGGRSFAELRAASKINEAAEAAHDDPDFSGQIRSKRK